MGRITKRVDKNKIQIAFDVRTLNAIIKYLRCEYVPNNQVYKLNKLMNMIDLNLYPEDIKLRLMIVERVSKLISLDNIRDNDIIESQLANDEEMYKIYANISPKLNGLSQNEVDMISKMIDHRMQALAIYRYRDEMTNLMNNFDTDGYSTSYTSTMEKIKEICGILLTELQESNADDSLIRSFSFSDKDFNDKLNVIVNKSKKPTAVLQTGIRQLNALLSPGFQSGRLYTIIGGTGKFKSGTLLNLADQIRKFNPQIVPYENGKRKTILYITLENSIEETVERLYDMYSGLNDELKTSSIAQVHKTLKDEGKFNFTDSVGIDIDMRYFGNLEINTSEIYKIVKELNNNGKQVICVILDYIKRIDSVHPSSGDERVRISYAGKEIKNIATELQIPIITAMQLNRGGNEILDASIRENKEDVARFVGTSNIGNCWDLAEDSDCVFLINLEMSKRLNRLFLSIKLLKLRGKLGKGSTYFNHPFINDKNIRLETDVDKDQSVSVISLSTDLISIDEDDVQQTVHCPINNPRPNIKAINNKKTVQMTSIIDEIVKKSTAA